VVFDAVYDAFRGRLLEGARALPAEPVISEASLSRILEAVSRATAAGAKLLSGGERVDRPGWHLEPTVLEGAAPDSEISCTELFGPVTVLYRVAGLAEAIELVNDSPYGLTSAIHTASVHRAMRFAEQAHAGVVVVNGGTHGSEPHMGFGGVKQSGTGWREAGVEALDVYSDWKVVNVVADPSLA
jgi:aldehyde dehydrogenase (NAD+)